MLEDYIYMAGFFDGEGCIRINKRKRKVNIEYTLFISIGQNDGAILDWIVSRFGGHVYRVKRDNSFMWATSNRSAHKILESITPYLKYKKPQALKALELQSNFRKTRIITKEEIVRRESIYQEVKDSKKVFSPSMFAGSTTKRTDSKEM